MPFKFFNVEYCKIILVPASHNHRFWENPPEGIRLMRLGRDLGAQTVDKVTVMLDINLDVD